MKKSSEERVQVRAGSGGEGLGRDESSVLIKRSNQRLEETMEVEDAQMQVQSYLCQLDVEDLKKNRSRFRMYR